MVRLLLLVRQGRHLLHLVVMLLHQRLQLLRMELRVLSGGATSAGRARDRDGNRGVAAKELAQVHLEPIGRLGQADGASLFELVVLLLATCHDCGLLLVRHLAGQRRTCGGGIELAAGSQSLARGRGAAHWRRRHLTLLLLLGRRRLGEQTLQVGRMLVHARGRCGRHRRRELLLLLQDKLLQLTMARLRLAIGPHRKWARQGVWRQRRWTGAAGSREEAVSKVARGIERLVGVAGGRLDCTL